MANKRDQARHQKLLKKKERMKRWKPETRQSHQSGTKKDERDEKEAQQAVRRARREELGEHNESTVKEGWERERERGHRGGSGSSHNVIDIKTGKFVGTHQYGVGFRASLLGRKLGYENHPRSIPDGTKMEGLNMDSHDHSLGIGKFLRSLTEKNYAQANKYLHAVMGDKIKNRIRTTAN